MASIPTTVAGFLELVGKSELVDAQKLATFERGLALPSLNGDPATSTALADGSLPNGQAGSLEPPGVAQRMIAEGLLTEFQATQILAGKHRGFNLGKYRILEQLGVGAMGTVYLASHIHLGRRVALKILAPRRRNPAALERFFREARAAAALDHPNLVRAYDVDEEGKLRFLVMEYVDGANLQRIVEDHGPLAMPRALSYVRQSALGLQYAHERGIVHRDIKPGNLLLDRRGTVKILDMGLVRFQSRDDNLTRDVDAGRVLGTADYISPEQALNCSSADIRSDIYSLGFTGYFLLTGANPFGAGMVTQKLIWHQTKQPPSVRELVPEVPEEVAALLLKMMEKDPSRRPQTPKEVADALAPFVPANLPPPPDAEMPQLCLAAKTGRVPKSHEFPTVIARAAKTTVVGRGQQKPAGKSVCGATPVVGRVSQPGAAGANGEATPTPTAHRQAPSPSGAARPAQSQEPDNRLSPQALKLIAGTIVAAIMILCLAAYCLFAAVQAVSQAGAETTGPRLGETRPPPRPQNLPPVAEGEVRRFTGHTAGLNRLALSPDGKTLATAGHDKSIRLWDVATGKELRRLTGHGDIVMQIAFAPGGKELLSTSKDTTARLWDVASGNELRRFNGHSDMVLGAAFAPDGRTCVTGSSDKTARVWDVATGQELRRFTGHNNIVIAVAFTPDGRRVLSGGGDRLIRYWEAASCNEVLRLEGHEGTVEAIAVSADGRRALSGGWDRTLRCWNLETGNQLHSYLGHAGTICSAVFSKSGNFALTGSTDQTMRIWNLQSGSEMHCFRGHTGMVTGVALTTDEQLACSCSHDCTARLWEIPRHMLAAQ